MDAVKFENISFSAGRVFSPSTPISRKTLFAGREYQLNRVIDLIFTPGQHGIIYGERGVGKTSLANILDDVFEPKPEYKTVFTRVNCDKSDNFSSIWLKAFNKTKLILTSKKIGFQEEEIKEFKSLTDLIGEKAEIAVDDITRIGSIRESRFVFIFDEFGRAKMSKTNSLFADTIKMLSDHSLNITIILIGVADSVVELLKEHASIDRSLIQILMPRMKQAELEKIIDTSLEQLNMGIDAEAKKIIVKLSQGLPHYTHLIGLAAAREALRDKRLQISDSDVRLGIKSALADAQQSIIHLYNIAVTSPRTDTLFKEVLLACALCSVDDLGYFAPRDVREPLKKILGRKLGISGFTRHLSNFCSDKRGQILSKTGDKRRYRFRFNNPLLQPYVVMKGIDERRWVDI